MALKLIQQDVSTLREAYEERKAEYDTLRAAGKWAGAVLYAGTLLELVLKLAICKHLGVANLPVAFQVHDLEFLLYCSGQQGAFSSNIVLQKNFRFIVDHWSTSLRYEGAACSKQEADEFDRALFDSASGVITFLTQYF